MLKSKSISRTFGVLIGILLVAQLLFDPISVVGNLIEKDKVQRELEEAQQLWEVNGSDSYEIKVRGTGIMGCWIDAMLTVRQGKLVGVQAREFLSNNSEYKVIDWQNQSTLSYCEYDDFTVSNIFSDVKKALESSDPFYKKPKITFDPKFGYVTYYQINYHRYGLFTWVKVSDCCAWYEFSEFEPLK